MFNSSDTGNCYDKVNSVICYQFSTNNKYTLKFSSMKQIHMQKMLSHSSDNKYTMTVMSLVWIDLLDCTLLSHTFGHGSLTAKVFRKCSLVFFKRILESFEETFPR